MISGEAPFTTLYISMARVCRFLTCIETELSFSRSCSKVHCFSLNININLVQTVYFVIFIILYCTAMTQPHKRTVVKLRIKKETFIRNVLFDKSMCDATRVNAFSLFLVFIKILFIEFLRTTFPAFIALFSLPLDNKWHLLGFIFILLSLRIRMTSSAFSFTV